MQYPVQLTQIGAEKAIYIPAYEAVKAIYADLLELDPATPFPYWAKVWPSAIALLNILQKHPNWIKDKNVLELGAGIGLPSLMMADMAESIQISDYNLEAVELLRKNIEHLELENAEALQLDWNNVPEHIQPDVVILSDVNYDPTQIDQLVVMINHFLKANSTVIISTPERITAKPFGNAIQPYIKESFLQECEESEKLMQIRIMML